MRFLSMSVPPLLFSVALLSFPAHAQDDAGELDQWYRDLELAGATAGDASAKPARASNWHGILGAGVAVAQRALGDERVLPFPLVLVSYRDTAYGRMSSGGVWLLKSDDRRTRLGIAGKIRRGFDPDDYAGLAGMTRRDASFEAGINAVWVTRPLTIRAAYYTDVSGTSDGESAMLGVSHPFRVGARTRIVPSVSAEWLDADVVDYYYGVTPSEATVARPAYVGETAVNVRAGVAMHYMLAHAWSLFGGVSHTHLGAGIANSPIVVNDDVAAAHVGAGWRF